MYYVYLLECSDGTLYCGYTNNLQLRLKAHNDGKGAKYTKCRRPVKMVFSEPYETKSEALKRECLIKTLHRAEKLKLIGDKIMTKPNTDSAAICGLFCPSCPSFIDGECGGCLSDNCCCDCFNGFKDCVKIHKVTRCYQCDNFPCEKLKDFSTKHIVNGICHHKDVLNNLQEMKERGVELWLDRQIAEHTCKKCGKIIPWYNKTCPHDPTK